MAQPGRPAGDKQLTYSVGPPGALLGRYPSSLEAAVTYPAPPTYLDFDDFAKKPPAITSWKFRKSTWNPANELAYTMTFIAKVTCSFGDDVEPQTYTFRFHTHSQLFGNELHWCFGGLWSDGLVGQHLTGEELGDPDNHYTKLAEIAGQLTQEHYKHVVAHHRRGPVRRITVPDDYKGGSKGEPWKG
jgi:hypothetical protein